MTSLDLAPSSQSRASATVRGGWINPLAALAAATGAGLSLWGIVVDGHAAHQWGAIVGALLVIAWVAVGLTATIQRPSETLGPLVLFGTLLGGIANLSAAALQARGTATHLSSLPIGAAQLGRAVSVALLPIVAMNVLLALPDGPSRLARSAVGASRVAHPAVGPSRVARSALRFGYLGGAALGLALWAVRPGFPLWPVVAEAVLVGTIGAVAAHHRYQRARGAELQRMQWFAWAVAVGCEVTLVAIAVRLLSGWPGDGSVILAAATVPLPVALTVGSSRRLFSHIPRLLTTTISLLGLSVVVVAVYLVVVLGLGRAPTHQERPLLVLSMAAAAVAALLYLPARERLAVFANRLVYGEREAPDEVLRSFGTRLTRALPLDELLLQVAESLRKTLVLETAEIWTGSEGQLERAVSVPDAPVVRLGLNHDEEIIVARAGVSGPAWVAIWLPSLLVGREQAVIRVAPINHSGRLLGLVVAARPETGGSFGPDDDTALAELSRQLGLALHNVELDSALQASLEEVKRQAEEVRASRARIVAASDAARRQIERDLHDGAQQHLVALAVNIRLARQMTDVDPDGVKELLEQLSHEISEAVQELRDLAHGIYPPLLMDRGLGPALHAAAGRAAIPADAQSEGIRRYRPEVEAAVYFCCLEALQNAAKYAGPGATARIRVWEEADGLLFEVSDNGVGFDPGAQLSSGQGFVNMGDRVGAIGGVFSLTAAPGAGTRVSGRIPLAGAVNGGQ